MSHMSLARNVTGKHPTHATAWPPSLFIAFAGLNYLLLRLM
jgi:hypothetical protein